MRVNLVVAAALLLSIPVALRAQRASGPAGIAVTGTAASATVSWEPVAGALSYSVKRWKQDDLKCCNNAVGTVGKPAWIDYGAANEGFAQAGTYVFEVTVLRDDKTTGASLFSWTRPEAAPVVTRTGLAVKTLGTLNLAAPAGVVVRTDPSALVFNWQAVSGATGYQIDAAPAATGPWAPVSPTPVSGTQFVYTPAPGVLVYYRLSAALSYAVSGNSTIVPFMYMPPLNPLGVSAAQSGANVTVRWNPVAGASGYTVTGWTISGGTLVQQVGGAMSSATFLNAAPPGLAANSYNTIRVRVTAQFPPQGAPGAIIGQVGDGVISLFDPNLCWPPAGVVPGGTGQSIAPPVMDGGTVNFSWPLSGQLAAYRVERTPAGTAQWESLACLRPLTTIDFNRYVRASSVVTEFRDQSIGLQPSTAYQYRFTAIGVPDATGKRPTSESIVAVTTPPALNLVVGAVAIAGTTARGVRLSWPLPGSAVKNYLITSSYGLRTDMYKVSPSNIFNASNVPSGTHQFSVTPLYSHGAPAATTTVTVVVP